jgi:hypothetical protein
MENTIRSISFQTTEVPEKDGQYQEWTISRSINSSHQSFKTSKYEYEYSERNKEKSIPPYIFVSFKCIKGKEKNLHTSRYKVKLIQRNKNQSNIRIRFLNRDI